MYRRPGKGQTSSTKGTSKGSAQKFSIFDVLESGPKIPYGNVTIKQESQTAPATAITETTATAESELVVSTAATAKESRELEWNRAEKGQLLGAIKTEKIEEDRVEVVVKEEQEEQVYQRPSMDVFKAIFESSESSEEDDSEEEADRKNLNQARLKVRTLDKEVELKADVADAGHDDEDIYGPRLPTAAIATTSFAGHLSRPVDEVDEWVEKKSDAKKRKKEASKKTSKKNKKEKKQKSKKKKRRRDDSSSSSESSSDVDKIILKKIVELKSRNRL